MPTKKHNIVWHCPRRDKQATFDAEPRTYPGTGMREEGRAWFESWNKLHPQFNTVD